MESGRPSRLEVLPAPSALCRAVVVIPARNEAASLTATLDALRLQVSANGEPLEAGSYEVLLLLNNCTDNSVEVAEQYAAHHPGFALHVVSCSLEPERAHVGTARRMLMDAACARLEGQSRRTAKRGTGDSFHGRRYAGRAGVGECESGGDCGGCRGGGWRHSPVCRGAGDAGRRDAVAVRARSRAAGSGGPAGVNPGSRPGRSLAAAPGAFRCFAGVYAGDLSEVRAGCRRCRGWRMSRSSMNCGRWGRVCATRRQSRSIRRLGWKDGPRWGSPGNCGTGGATPRAASRRWWIRLRGWSTAFAGWARSGGCTLPRPRASTIIRRVARASVGCAPGGAGDRKVSGADRLRWVDRGDVWRAARKARPARCDRAGAGRAAGAACSACDRGCGRSRLERVAAD